MCKVSTYRTDCRSHGYKEDVYFETDQCAEFRRTGEVCKITMFGEYNMRSCVHCRAQEQGGYYPTKDPPAPKKLKKRFDLDEEPSAAWLMAEAAKKLKNKLAVFDAPTKKTPVAESSTKKEKVDKSDWMG